MGFCAVACGVATGDKYTNAMQLSSTHHAGCIIRIKKDGSIPNGNMDGSQKPKACWAYGLRNGFKSFCQSVHLAGLQVGLGVYVVRA